MKDFPEESVSDSVDADANRCCTGEAADGSTLAGRSIVIKYGGSANDGRAQHHRFARDVAELQAAGAQVVIVHGGGNEMTRMAAALGIDTVFVDGQRVTDSAMIGIALMVLAGRINKEMVASLRSHGINAFGLCGIDGGLLTASRHPSSRDLGFVGTITSVSVEPLLALFRGRFLPVIAPTALGEDGEIYNVNADVAATSVAIALAADELLFVSDVAGVMVDGVAAGCLDVDEAWSLVSDGTVSGGMIPKIESAIDAIRRGVASVRIVDGRSDGALLKALAGGRSGTKIRPVRERSGQGVTTMQTAGGATG